jgi:hypothetical protein
LKTPKTATAPAQPPRFHWLGHSGPGRRGSSYLAGHFRRRGAHYLHEVYTRSDPTYSGHVTVPVLWDKKTGTIVNRVMIAHKSFFNRVPARGRASCSRSGVRLLVVFPSLKRSLLIEW